MRLYRALCAWLEAATEQMRHEDAGGRDHQLDSLVETAHAFTAAPELHTGYRGQSIDDDDGGVYRLGFQPNPRRRG